MIDYLKNLYQENKIIIRFGFELEFVFLILYFIRPLSQKYYFRFYVWNSYLIFLTVILTVLFIIYFLAQRQIKINHFGKDSLKLIILFSLLYSLTLIILPPAASGDIYNYVMHSRILSVYQQNPYLTYPANFSQDSVYHQIGEDWQKMPSTYGPFWFYLAYFPSLIAKNSIALAIFLFKFLGFLFYLGGIFLVYKILNILKIASKEFTLLLYAWNPLIIFEAVNNAHNDIMVGFLLILAAYFFLKNQNFLSFLSLLASFLIKYITVILMPVIFWESWNRLKSFSLKIKYLMRIILSTALFVGLAYLPFWRGLKTFQGVIVQSSFYALPSYFPLTFIRYLSHSIKLIFPSIVSSLSEIELMRYMALSLFLLFYLFIIFYFKIEKDQDIIKKFFWVIFLYLFLLTFYFQAWYFLWILPILVLIPEKNYRKLYQLLTILGIFTYWFFK